MLICNSIQKLILEFYEKTEKEEKDKPQSWVC